MTETSQRELESYPDEVQWIFRQADGYLDLDMPDEAHHQLDKLQPEYLSGTLYEEFLLRLAFVESDWSAAARTAELLIERVPDYAQFYIQLAYATRRSKGIEHAERILQDALRRFPDEMIINYNLACYAVVRGDHNRAVVSLKKIIHEPGVLDMALEDEDLKPIWSQLG